MQGKRPKAGTKRVARPAAFNLQVEFDRETDGRWIADILALPGVMVYGRTRKEALTAVEALALRVIADRLEHGEAAPVLRRRVAKR
jgi:predicted RNase H-like HicB family nuclease